MQDNFGNPPAQWGARQERTARLERASGAYREAPYVVTQVSMDANRYPKHDAAANRLSIIVVVRFRESPHPRRAYGGYARLVYGFPELVPFCGEEVEEIPDRYLNARITRAIFESFRFR